MDAPDASDSRRTEGAQDLRAGRVLFGRYRLLRLLGRGSVGSVWLADDNRLSRLVALKLLTESFGADRDAVEQLRREARRALALTHPNIVRIFDFAATENEAGIAMEYVDGAPLDVLYRMKGNGVLEVDEIRPWVAQICSALAYAHGKALIVHRDLKPANLLIDVAGNLKIADFGLSAPLIRASTRGQTSATPSGSPAYMSPQQLAGAVPSVADDIYSLGVTLFELLTGRPPFFRGDITLAARIDTAPLMGRRRIELGVAGKAIPAEWEKAVAACLSKDPKLRPASAEMLLSLLGGGLGTAASLTADPSGAVLGEMAEREEESHEERAETAVRRSWVVGGFLVTMLAIGFAIGWWSAPVQRSATPLPVIPAQPAAKGGVVVRASPAGAAVAVGDFALDRSPLVVTGHTVGRYPVVVSLDGFEEWRGEVEIPPNSFVELDVELQPIRGVIEVSSEPAGLEVRLSGDKTSATGRTPWRVGNLPPGEYVVEVARRPEWSTRRLVALRRSEVVPVAVALHGGELDITTEPAGVDVWIDGGNRGRTPLQLADWAPGAITVQFRCNGVELGQSTAEVRSGQRTEIRMRFDDRVRQLTMVVEPIVILDLGMRFLPVPETELLFSVYETRVRDFAAFVAATGHRTEAELHPPPAVGGRAIPTWRDPGFLQGPDHPVVGVGVADADAFCRWLTERERAAGRLSGKLEYRLPEEHEWHAANGRSKYPWGPEWPPLGKVGNFADLSAHRARIVTDVLTRDYDDLFAYTASVGSFRANAFGLFDMGGNASELVAKGGGHAVGGSFLDVVNDYSGAIQGSARGASVARTGFRVVCARSREKGS